MISVVSISQAYDADIASVSSGLISEKQLISNAAMSIYKYCANNIEDYKDKKFLFVAGKGNNGMDAIEAHKIFKKNKIFSNLFLMKNIFVGIENLRVDLEDVIASSNPDFAFYDVIVDGLIGIGLKGALKADYESIVKKVNKSKRIIISIDIPSGLDADSGMDNGTSIKADHTITMGFPKMGLYFNKGKENSGIISIADIGYPEKIKNFHSKVLFVDKEDVKSCAKIVSKNSDKYSRGYLGTLVGSKKYSGAAVLAIKSAVVAGAGIVKSMIPESIRTIIDSNSIESISIPFNDKNVGYLSKKSDLTYAKKLAVKSDCILVGSGLDESTKSMKFVSEVISFDCKSLVLDGTGLLCLSDNYISIDNLPKNTIMTPHYKEFSEIFKLNLNKVKENPIESAKSVVTSLGGRVLILKGPTTIIINSKGELLILTNGSEILSTAGTGDVLAGIVSSLLSQGYSLNSSALLGTWIHGEASNIYVNDKGRYGLTASKLIEFIPTSFNSL